MSKAIKYLGVTLLAMAVFSSCANRGSGPQGGPKDETPPVLEKCTPEFGTTNVDTLIKSIKMEFNENMAIKDAYKYVIVSPPSKNKPNVKAVAKNVITSFDDTLKAGTTYAICYGNSLTDNNEGNILKNYTYVFSTGDVLDTLSIDGYIIDAHTLAPVPDIIAGIYPNSTDTTFTTTPFYRVAKTDSTGYFNIAFIPDGEYSLFALKDAAGDWYYSQKEGGTVAFWDSIVVPKKIDSGQFTVDSLQLKADTLSTNNYQLSTKEPVRVLKLFTEERKQEYFKKAMHPRRELFVLVFGHKPTMMPELRVIDNEQFTVDSLQLTVDTLSTINCQFLLETSKERPDSLVYWVTDSLLLKSDTLRLEMKYMKTDSIGELTLTTDTLKLSVPKKRVAQKKKKAKDGASGEEKPVIEFINMTHNFKESMEVTDTITLKFAEPIATILYDSITLLKKVDTLMVPVPISFEIDDSLCTKELRVIYDKEPGETYKINIDSAAIFSLYGRHNTKFYKKFALKKLEEYANLYISFVEQPENAIFELMDEKEEVKYRELLEDGEVTFQDVIPGKYYLRMFIDANGNGIWDTGDVKNRIQPEDVYYMPEVLNLPANWDVEQKWDYNSFDILKQRPEGLNKKK